MANKGGNNTGLHKQTERRVAVKKINAPKIKQEKARTQQNGIKTKNNYKIPS